MILRSEGDNLKLINHPPRDQKYVVCAFSDLFCEKSDQYLEDSLKNNISSLIELSYKSMT